MWIEHCAPPRVPPRVKIEGIKIVNFQLSIIFAGVVELADTLDLGAVTSGKVFIPQR